MVMWITIRLPHLPGTMMNSVGKLHFGKSKPATTTNLLLLISGFGKLAFKCIELSILSIRSITYFHHLFVYLICGHQTTLL